MSNTLLEGLVKAKDYTFKKQLFKIVKEYNLSINELILLIYFLNQDNPSLNVEDIKENAFMNENDILSSYTTLNSKSLIAVKMKKNKSGKLEEVIDLSNVYKAMVSEINTKIKKAQEISVFSIFEKEFARTLSPIEYELINAWISSGIKEEIIIGALKEAIYNGVNNLRYIDKIIYEWGKKGFKTMEDVNNHLKTKNNKKNEPAVLFDYNWLEDEE